MRYLPIFLLVGGCAAIHPAPTAEPCPSGYECLTEAEAVEVAATLIMQETKIKHLENLLRNINLKQGCV